MRRFNNILLVAGDEPGTRTSLDRAAELARNNKARLTLIDVLKGLPPGASEGGEGPSVDLAMLLVEHRRMQLEDLISPFKSQGLKVSTEVLVGRPFIEIIRKTLLSEHDLVIKPAEGGGLRKAGLFGSNDMHLLRKCPCPVWIIKPTKRKEYAHILAAVDLDPSDDQIGALNTQIMDLATSMARSEGSQLHVVHAWSLYGENMLRVGFGKMPSSKVDGLAMQERDRHTAWLSELLGKYDLDDLSPQVHLLKGEPKEVLPAVARSKQVELIVMGTVCRTGIAGLIIGNTAESILCQADCSVLAVKPGRFVTPVKL